MSRCSLSRVVLMSKILDMGTPKQLLASALDPPDLTNIILTIRTLKQVILCMKISAIHCSFRYEQTIK